MQNGKILFFDDRWLDAVRYTVRKNGRAELMKDSLYGDASEDIFANIPNVIYSKPLGCYLMLTYGMHLREFYDVIQIHQSEDGIHWKPLDTTGILNLKTRRFPNQLFELGQCGEYSVYEDLLAENDQRFKLLGIRRKENKELETCLFVSEDGLHWTDQHVTWHPNPPDLGPLTIFRNDQRNCYTIATRPDMVDRRVALIETTDWIHYSQPVTVLETDALDTPLCESYGLTVMQDCNYYLGIYWLYHPNADQIIGIPGGTTSKYFDGYVDAQITSSENGVYFKRGLRESVLSNGTPGENDCGCIYPRQLRKDTNGDYLIHACVYPFEHGRWRNFVNEKGSHKSIGVYRIREDGFCYLQNIGGYGFIGTRALQYEGGPVTLNVQCPTGLCSVQVTDYKGTPVLGYCFEDMDEKAVDSTDWEPVWSGGRKLDELKGQVIRLEIKWKTGRLYGIHGKLQLLLHPPVEK